MLAEKMEQGVREHFKLAQAKRDFDKNDVEAGREFVRAYVQYIHYVEGVHQATTSPVHAHTSEMEAAGRPAH